MHEHARVYRQPLFFFLILPTITNSTRGWPHLGLPTLLTAGERSKVTEKRETSENDAMHMCVCLITLDIPLIICNLAKKKIPFS